MRKQTKLVAVLSAAALLAIGASMTSFAATRGWVQEGEDWVYLDNDGERVFNQWKRSGDFYYYLGEDGVMVTDQLIHDDTLDAYYYVNENGVRIMNDWKSIPNDEGVQVGDNTPEVLYYHFGAAGKADRSTGDALKVKSVDGKYYAFDTEGRMASGWQWIEINDEPELYYFGTELEGWARTGWQQLEPGENLRAEEEYDDLEWFYFENNGRAAKDKSKNIGGKYYAFDANGVMRSDWYTVSTEPMAASDGIAFASSNGTLASGWVYTNPQGEDDADDVWFYLVTIRDGSKVKRSVPYNRFPADYEDWIYETDEDESGNKLNKLYLGKKGVRAKVIKNKTYIFDTDGQMLTGFVVINNDGKVSPDIKAMADVKEGTSNVEQIFNNFTSEAYGAVDTESTNAIKGRKLADGLYYFNEAGGSVNGQLMTGRTAVTKDGETFYYYFNKTGIQTSAEDYGVALHSTVRDGYLYGKDGRCLTNDDGNAYAVYKVSELAEWHCKDAKDSDTTTMAEGIKLYGKSGDASIIGEKLENGKEASVVVSKSGRIKQSGTATIDGTKYTIKNYVVTDATIID